MILVDTSVWIAHFRAGSERLKTLLFDQQVLCHPFIVGELACGNLRRRSEILSMLKALPQAHLHRAARRVPTLAQGQPCRRVPWTVGGTTPATNRSGRERLRRAPWLNDAMRDTVARVVLALLTKPGSEVSWRARSASGRTEQSAERYTSTAARYQIQ